MPHIDFCQVIGKRLYDVLQQRRYECIKLGVNPDDEFSIRNIRDQGLSEEQDEALRKFVLAHETYDKFQDYWERCGTHHGVWRSETKGNPWEVAWYDYLVDVRRWYPITMRPICKRCDWVSVCKSVGKLPCMHRCPFAFNGIPISEPELTTKMFNIMSIGYLPYVHAVVDIFGEGEPHDVDHDDDPPGLY